MNDSATCVVPDCGRQATNGENWRAECGLTPLVAHQKGIELKLTVRDIAVVLELCDEHAGELTGAAWKGALDVLAGWGWEPLAAVYGR